MKIKWILIPVLLLGISCKPIKQLIHPASSEPILTNHISGIWYIVSVNAEKVVESKAGKEMPFLDFNVTDKKVSGSTGCNRLTGEIIITNSSIDFGQLAVTRMMCRNAIYETPILQLLRGNLSYKLENGNINIFKESRVIMSLAR